MTPQLQRETLQTLEECVNTLKTHEFLLGSIETVPLDDNARGAIAEGLHATVSKLENLRKEILLAD